MSSKRSNPGENDLFKKMPKTILNGINKVTFKKLKLKLSVKYLSV